MSFCTNHILKMDQGLSRAQHVVQKQRFPFSSTDFDGGQGNYLYEIEQITGGLVYPGNAEVTDAAVMYKSVNGIVVSLNRGEVKSLKKTKVDD